MNTVHPFVFLAPAPSGVLLQIAHAIVRDAMPATSSGATCFVPRYQIDALRAALPAAPTQEPQG